MKQVSLAVLFALLAAGCGSKSTATTPSTPASTNVTFTAALLPSNEAPNPVSNAESVASGSASIVFVLSKDAAGAITTAVGTATVTLQGFPAGSTITLAHIHTGPAGVAGGVLIGFVPGGAVTLTNGAGSFSQTATITGSDAANIINNPAGFYFNVHSALNPGGVMRGQLKLQ